jgi:hypothetical protein
MLDCTSILLPYITKQRTGCREPLALVFSKVKGVEFHIYHTLFMLEGNLVIFCYSTSNLISCTEILNCVHLASSIHGFVTNVFWVAFVQENK